MFHNASKYDNNKHMLLTALSWPRGDLLFPTASSKATQTACDRNQVEVEDPTSSKLVNGSKCFDTGFLFIVCMWKCLQSKTPPNQLVSLWQHTCWQFLLRWNAGHPVPATVLSGVPPRDQQRSWGICRVFSNESIQSEGMWTCSVCEKNKTKVSYGLKKLLYATTPWSKKPKNHPRSKWQAEFLAHLGVGPKFLHEPSSTHQVGFVHVGG